MASQKILITGATGFLGTNLQEYLALTFPGEYEIYAYNSKSDPRELCAYTNDCDFVFHFAAVHRPPDVLEFSRVNVDLFALLLQNLEENKNPAPVLYTSSVQACDDSPYGHSKVRAEELLEQHCKTAGSAGMVYRLTNTFGPHARPNGHSVVATFCHNINRNLPIQVNNPAHVMRLYYIGDVIDHFIENLRTPPTGFQKCSLSEDLICPITLQQLAQKLQDFHAADNCGAQPLLANAFDQKLYHTFKSYKE